MVQRGACIRRDTSRWSARQRSARSHASSRVLQPEPTDARRSHRLTCSDLCCASFQPSTAVKPCPSARPTAIPPTPAAWPRKHQRGHTPGGARACAAWPSRVALCTACTRPTNTLAAAASNNTRPKPRSASYRRRPSAATRRFERRRGCLQAGLRVDPARQRGGAQRVRRRPAARDSPRQPALAVGLIDAVTPSWTAHTDARSVSTGDRARSRRDEGPTTV